MRKKLLAITVVAGMAAGCATTDPYSGQQKTSNTGKGAGAGAVAGAVVGALSKHNDRGKGALAGAAVGAAVGGGIGYYMDKQETALRQRLEGTGVRVQRNGDEIKLIMPGNITFDSGRSELMSHFYSTLDSVAEVLTKFNKTNVDVSGHTDSTGSVELNQRLSEDRARSVVSYLQSRGIPSQRLFASGYGSRFPLADNSTAAGRSENRRVEIELRPIQ